MLVLKRSEGQDVTISISAEDIEDLAAQEKGVVVEVKFLEFISGKNSTQVRVGFEAPPEVLILRDNAKSRG